MKKFVVFLLSMAILFPVTVPGYAANSATDTVTVNVTVERWIEIALVDPQALSLTIDSSEAQSAQTSLTIKANDDSWFLVAAPNWGQFDGVVSFLEEGNPVGWPAKRHNQQFVTARYIASSGTAVDGLELEMNVEIWSTGFDGQSANLLEPGSGSFNIELLAYYGN